MKKGDEIILDIEKFADKGKSLSRVDGCVVFIAGAVPGDKVRARVFKKKKSFAEARLLELVTPSPLRTDPLCPYFGTCGGCKWQHVQYQAQLDAKTLSVQEALVHHGGFEDIEVLPAIASDKEYYYRNKMEFSFSAERWLTSDEITSGEYFERDFALGLHVPGSFNKVLDLHECHLQSELSARIVNGVRTFARENEWLPWHIRNHTGYLRHLVIRQSARTPDLMVNLVTSGNDSHRMAAFGDWMQKTFPEVTTLINTINTGVAQTAFGEEMLTVYGPGVIHDMIGDLTFEIAPNAFFQTNTGQAEKLYKVAAEFAQLKPSDLVYDLYCGAGTISLFVAPAVERVVGVESVGEAVDSARRNASANGISNVTFVQGDMMRLFNPDFIGKYGKPDVLIVDPPRAGMHPKVVRQIERLAPERFVYVSCNPLTQARDLAALSEVFTLDAVQPVDLFPHTHHVESVAMLTAR